MTDFTDVFGHDTVPPAEYGYSFVSLTSDVTFFWPYNSASSNVTSKIMEVDATVPGLTMTMPSATEVSDGEDLLIRNLGANAFTVANNIGGSIATINPGEAKYFYVTNNASPAGDWSILAYGAGSSAVDAGALVGFGIKAIGATLNQSHVVADFGSIMPLNSSFRAAVYNYLGGTDTLPLPASATLGNDFFFLLRNSGTGTLTIDPDIGELIDGTSTIMMQPGESALLVCTGSEWVTVGLGRSLQYNFTQLVYDVTVGSPFTLTAGQAANKLLKFIGAPIAPVTVIVPSVVAVYYIFNNLSTAQPILIKTALGSGALVQQGQRVIVICDGVDVVSAQSAATSSSVLLIDGSAASPAVAFASSTNTGMYKHPLGIGFSVNGTLEGYVGPEGFTNKDGEPLISREDSLGLIIALS